MRAMLLGLLFVSVVAAQDDRIRELVEKLGSDDPAVREASERDLIKLGEKALADVRKAEASTDAEIRARAKRVRETIELELRLKKNDLTWLKEAAPKELALAVQDGGVELKAAEGFEKAEGRCTIFRFLDRAIFEKASMLKGTSADGKFDVWSIVAREAHLFCHLPSDGGFPRYFAVQLPSKIELTEAGAKWDKTAHAVPCLAKAKAFSGEDWKELFLQKQQRIGGGILYSYEWAQDRPYPRLRHLYLTEKLALLCIAYQ